MWLFLLSGTFLLGTLAFIQYFDHGFEFSVIAHLPCEYQRDTRTGPDMVEVMGHHDGYFFSIILTHKNVGSVLLAYGVPAHADFGFALHGKVVSVISFPRPASPSALTLK